MDITIPVGLWDCLDSLTDLDLTLGHGICLHIHPFHQDFPVLLSIGIYSRF